MADQDLYGLNNADVALLRELIRDYRDRRINSPSRGRADHGFDDTSEGHQSTDVYVCQVPPGGIPALTLGAGTAADTPGKATCDIYRINDDQELVALQNVSKMVYNVATIDITSDWASVHKTKGGKWLVAAGVGQTTGTGTITDTDELVKATANDIQADYLANKLQYFSPFPRDDLDLTVAFNILNPASTETLDPFIDISNYGDTFGIGDFILNVTSAPHVLNWHGGEGPPRLHAINYVNAVSAGPDGQGGTKLFVDYADGHSETFRLGAAPGEAGNPLMAPPGNGGGAGVVNEIFVDENANINVVINGGIGQLNGNQLQVNMMQAIVANLRQNGVAQQLVDNNCIQVDANGRITFDLNVAATWTVDQIADFAANDADSQTLEFNLRVLPHELDQNACGAVVGVDQQNLFTFTAFILLDDCLELTTGATAPILGVNRTVSGSLNLVGTPDATPPIEFTGEVQSDKLVFTLTYTAVNTDYNPCNLLFYDELVWFPPIIVEIPLEDCLGSGDTKVAVNSGDDADFLDAQQMDHRASTHDSNVHGLAYPETVDDGGDDKLRYSVQTSGSLGGNGQGDTVLRPDQFADLESGLEHIGEDGFKIDPVSYIRVGPDKLNLANPHDWFRRAYGRFRPGASTSYADENTAVLQAAITHKYRFDFPPGPYIINDTIQIGEDSGFRVTGDGGRCLSAGHTIGALGYIGWGGAAGGTMFQLQGTQIHFDYLSICGQLSETAGGNQADIAILIEKNFDLGLGVGKMSFHNLLVSDVVTCVKLTGGTELTNSDNICFTGLSLFRDATRVLWTTDDQNVGIHFQMIHTGGTLSEGFHIDDGGKIVVEQWEHGCANCTILNVDGGGRNNAHFTLNSLALDGHAESNVLVDWDNTGGDGKVTFRDLTLSSAISTGPTAEAHGTGSLRLYFDNAWFNQVMGTITMNTASGNRHSLYMHHCDNIPGNLLASSPTSDNVDYEWDHCTQFSSSNAFRHSGGTSRGFGQIG